MKKTITIFLLLIMSAAINTEAQRRDHQNGRDKNHHQSENRSRSNNGRDHKDPDDKARLDHKSRQEPNYDHRRPVAVHHHKPRYIYYRDYDVYYDSHRSIYISYSGRRWTVSNAMPLAMRHVNVRTTRSYEVDYYHDDFPSYLERRRPAYGREYAGW